MGEILLGNTVVDTKHLGNMSQKDKVSFTYSGIIGDAVRVQHDHSDHMVLAEVQVFGQHLDNIALQGTATQSCNAGGHPHASKAIDGNTDGGWWRLTKHTLFMKLLFGLEQLMIAANNLTVRSILIMQMWKFSSVTPS